MKRRQSKAVIFLGATDVVERQTFVATSIIQLPSASPPAIERSPQGSLMCTLGGSRREKQKRKGEEEEEEDEEEEEEEEEE